MTVGEKIPNLCVISISESFLFTFVILDGFMLIKLETEKE